MVCLVVIGNMVARTVAGPGELDLLTEKGYRVCPVN